MISSVQKIELVFTSTGYAANLKELLLCTRRYFCEVIVLGTVYCETEVNEPDEFEQHRSRSLPGCDRL